MFFSPDRHLRRAIREDLSSFLEEHGFVEVVSPEFAARHGKHSLLYRSPAFELMLAGRTRDDVSVSGRPLYQLEDWYSMPSALAVVKESLELIGVHSLAELRGEMELSYGALEAFFSPAGAADRRKVAEWEEAHYWRRMKPSK